ncbi:hypothetical protein FA15DRAFT_79510 [Coprinopsis marcescibilis]|uniref:Uncharacterized protein n=1 Tax=Coprinopsis marcescibilis TaxID=230819 RepID=A0A5C3KMA3_COPMA|nr:hypothetical protein FA15DRAFT_79510 [Coprinopsis marcescibilis]
MNSFDATLCACTPSYTPSTGTSERLIASLSAKSGADSNGMMTTRPRHDPSSQFQSPSYLVLASPKDKLHQSRFPAKPHYRSLLYQISFAEITPKPNHIPTLSLSPPHWLLRRLHKSFDGVGGETPP